MTVIEISTKKITEDQLRHFIDKAKAKKVLYVVDQQDDILNFKTESLPSLVEHNLDGEEEVSLDLNFMPVPHIDDSTQMELLHRASAFARFSSFQYDVSDCGREFDPTEELDVSYKFGKDDFGCFIGVSIGGVSPASKDLEYRKKIFSSFFLDLGIQDLLSVDVESGNKFYLKVLSEDISFPIKMNFSSSDYDSTSKNLVRVDGGDFERNNFNSIYVYFYDIEELVGTANKLIQRKKIVNSQFMMNVCYKNYVQLRDGLNELSLPKWNIEFWSLSEITIDNLFSKINNYDSALLNIVKIDLGDNIDIEVKIEYGGGNFLVHFSAFNDHKKEGIIVSQLRDMFDGEEILNLEG